MNNSSIYQEKLIFSGFFELLDYLQPLSDSSKELIQSIYIKNVILLKASSKFSKNAPDFNEVSRLYTDVFLSKSYDKKEECFKSFFHKTKTLLVWLISVYELLSHKPFDNFVSFIYIYIKLSNFHIFLSHLNLTIL